MTQIIIKKAYFDNIKVSIDAINEFFSSQFKVKNFPSIESELDIDPTINSILSLLDFVEPSWIDNQDKVDACIGELNDQLQQAEESEEDNFDYTPFQGKINACIGYKVLQFISDNFDSFSELLNAIYTFDLFMNTSKYEEIINKMSQPIDLSEIHLPESYNGPVFIFSTDFYVGGIFSNKAYIQIPLNKDEELTRMKSFADCQNCEVIVDDREEDDIEEVEESYKLESGDVTAETSVNTVIPRHIKYDVKTDKFKISKQLQALIQKLSVALEKCDTSEDLTKFFKNDINEKLVELLTGNESPFILNKVFLNPNKFTASSVDRLPNLSAYSKAYNNTRDKNNGAIRFFSYDIYTTFKVDKLGTIQFLKDFLSCNLYNDANASISNNTILTLFNIFDSRIYFDRLYSLIPENVKKQKYPTEDGFVKKIRSRINTTSHSKKVYDTDNTNKPSSVKSASEVQEFVYKTMKQLKDCSISDMQNVALYEEMVNAEISIIGNLMYNEHVSLAATDTILLQEMEFGNIPDYMKDRIYFSDKTPDDIDVTNVSQDEIDDALVPDNSFDDLATSIDNKLNSYDGDNVDDMLGTGYEERKSDDGKTVYNITNHYNYTNSFNKNSNNTENDSSSGKTINTINTNSNNDTQSINTNSTTQDDLSKLNNPGSVSGSKIPPTVKGPDVKPSEEPEIKPTEGHESIPAPKEEPKPEPKHEEKTEDKPKEEPKVEEKPSTNNSNNNSETVDDTIISNEEPVFDDDEDDKFSNGLSIKEFFSILEVAEPLSDSVEPVKPNQKAKMPKETNTTKTIDRDRKMHKHFEDMLNDVNAHTLPMRRVKRSFTAAINSLIKRDEDKVKAEILEDHTYRHWLQKIARFAIRLGATGVAFTINGYFGAVVLLVNVMREKEKKERLSREFQNEFATELKIIDERIKRADEIINDGRFSREKRDKAYQAKWQLMRLRNKVEQWMISNGTNTGHFVTNKQVAF